MKCLLIFFISTFLYSENDNFPYMDANLSINERTEDLMSRMTLFEKACQMNQFVGLEHVRKIEKNLSLDEINRSDSKGFYKGLLANDIEIMISEGEIGSFLHVLNAEEANYLQNLTEKSRLKIPLLIGIDAIHGNALVKGATVYPSPITLASTWDEKNSFDVARQTALEMRATGSHWAFSPNIDVLRDPRWGRVGETFGEDPLLVSNMGTSMIKGLQLDNFTGFDKVIACAKHLIAGSEPINGLNLSPTDISSRTLNEIYLPPYKSAVEAGVFSIMAAHNEINGVPSHANKELMTNLIRDNWGFNGFFVSDWLDIERLETLHHIAKDFKEATMLAVSAGIDMHMHGPLFPEKIVELVNEGKLSEDRINYACSKILEAKFKLGLFENRYVDLNKIENILFNQKHRSTALETARQGIVLLKNNSILPLTKTPSKKNKILVTGPNANNQSILGDWHNPQPDNNIYTVYEGIKEIGENIGYSTTFHDSNQNIKRINDFDILKTVEVGKKHDIIIVVVGDNSMRYRSSEKTAGENMARTKLNLAGNQLKLVKELNKLNKKIIVVYINGKPISEPWISKNIPAIIEGWEPGLMGGKALAEIIFGYINPSGKLPLTISRNVGQLRNFYNHKPSQFFREYAFESNKPLYPFGYGLSYTKFEISKPIILDKNFENNKIRVKTLIQNIGNFSGDEIVQLYIRDMKSSVTRPVKELKAYKRISLKANESKEIIFELDKSSFSFFNLEMDYVLEPGLFKIMVGNSSRDEDLKHASIEVY